MKDPNYEKFLEQRGHHASSAKSMLRDLILSAQALHDYIESTPDGCDYYAAATGFAEKHSSTPALVLRELMGIRFAYEAWKPGPGYPSQQ